MLCARELMVPPGVNVDPDDEVNHALALLRREGLSGLPVVNSCQQLLGYLTEREVLHLMQTTHAEGGKVYLFMQRDVPTVDVRASALDVEQFCSRIAASQVWVTERGQLVGTITRRDVTRLLSELRLTAHRSHVDRSLPTRALRRNLRTTDGPVGNRLGNPHRVVR